MPTVGRIVHFHRSPKHQPEPALVVGVHPADPDAGRPVELLTLVVWDEHGDQRVMSSVPRRTAERTRACWEWPVRVGEGDGTASSPPGATAEALPSPTPDDGPQRRRKRT